MARLWIFFAEHSEVILGFLGVISAYFLNSAQREFLLHRLDFLKEKLQRWRDFRKQHPRLDRYITLIITLLSAASFAPLIIEEWPNILGWWQTTHSRHPEIIGWLLFVLALCAAFGLYELRKQRLKTYAYLEVLVGVGVVAVISFDGTQARMAMGAKLAAAIYAIIRGLVNRDDARKAEEDVNRDEAAEKPGQPVNNTPPLVEVTA